MSSLIAAGLAGVMVLALGAHAVRAQDNAPRIPPTMASGSPDSSSSGADGPADQDASLKGRIVNFIESYYLSSEALSGEEILKLYGPRVRYFDGKVLSPRQIADDKRAYYKRWPDRKYRLLRDTVEVSSPPDQPRIYNVTFDYLFDVARKGRVSRGRGRAQLTLDMRLEGGVITRETGSVVQRWH
ncbi:MAG: hypothetical protein ACK5JT_08190 [Hyphomicrobiaceae bacterium]